jgi:hypothetical protein
MVIVVGPGLTVVEVWRRDPLGLTVSEFDCSPAFIGHLVVGLAGQGQLVDVGPAAAGPVVDVVNFRAVSGDVAAGGRTAAVLGMDASVVHPKTRCPVGRFESFRGHPGSRSSEIISEPRRPARTPAAP